MATTIRYIGAQDAWPELAVTKRPSLWHKGQQEERSDAEANLLLGTGLFSVVVATTQTQITGIQTSFPIPFATIGDSLSTATNAGLSDATKVTSGFNTKAAFGNRLAFAVPFVSNGLLRHVADCGISGETTTNLLARDALATSTSRRSISDAAMTGAQVALISIGVNDICFGGTPVTGASTPAQIDTLLNGTLYPNIIAVMKRVYAQGMWPVYRAMPGFGPGTLATSNSFSQADIDAKATTIKRATAYVRDVIIPALGFGAYADTRAGAVDESTGYWLPGFSVDGLHEGPAGVQVIAKIAASTILRWANPASPFGGKYALIGQNVASGNAFAWPAFTNVSSGQVVGFATTANTGIGSNSQVKSVAENDGSLWQIFDVTPLTFDGNGRASYIVTVDFAVTGGTPIVPFAAGDLYATEFDLVIESASGGAPTGVISVSAQTALFYNAGASSTTFYEMEANTSSNYMQPCIVPLAGTIVSKPIPAPDISANMTTARSFITVFANTTDPYRIRIANVRGVKLRNSQ